jgi:hypothetical protein
MIERIDWQRYLIALLPVCLVVLLALIGVIKTFNDPTAGPPKGPLAGIGEIAGTARACQTFRAAYDGLDRIDVRLDNLGRPSSGTFAFVLWAAPDASEDLVALTHNAAEVGSDAYHTFAFPPIAGSAGQRYAFCLTAPQAELEGAITAIGTLEDVYPQGEATFRDMWGQAAGVQDLDFHLGYRLPLWRKLVLLTDRLAEYKPYFFGARGFYAALAAVYLALLYALFVKLFSEHQAREE